VSDGGPDDLGDAYSPFGAEAKENRLLPALCASSHLCRRRHGGVGAEPVERVSLCAEGWTAPGMVGGLDRRRHWSGDVRVVCMGVQTRT